MAKDDLQKSTTDPMGEGVSHPGESRSGVSDSGATDPEATDSDVDIAGSFKDGQRDFGTPDIQAGQDDGVGYRPSAAEIARRNRRSLWIAFAMVGFIVLVYLITMLRLGQAISNGTFPV